MLRNCAKLRSVDGLDQFRELDHLNLSGCENLTSLPSLPPKLRYLALHGSQNLRLFRGQGLRESDRGKEGENVAPRFRSRLKFGDRLALMPHAKLLLLGDGRVGKTTLAKRLQWEELRRRKASAPWPLSLDPLRESPSTHGIQFWPWATHVQVGQEALEEARASARAAGVTFPECPDGSLPANLWIWDFGGQEIYHRTHRLFAREGAVFLIVWRRERPDIGRPPRGWTDEQWRVFNRHRPIDYWLDYVEQIRAGAKVELVCTAHAGEDLPNWRSPGPAATSRHAGRQEIRGYAFDSKDPRFDRPESRKNGLHEYTGLENWVRSACGAEAARIGILQPEFYARVAQMVVGWLQENDQARSAHRSVPHLLLTRERWEEAVRGAHEALAIEWRTRGVDLPPLDPEDIGTLTRYLHDAGQIFEIQSSSNPAVLVDQQWAAGILYDLLHTQDGLHNRIQAHGGWFYQEELESQAVWRAIPNDTQRQVLLTFMEECQLVVNLGAPKHAGERRGVFLALDRWLLPERTELAEAIESKLAWQQRQQGAVKRVDFEFEQTGTSEFEFERLQARMAKIFRASALYFRHGLLAVGKGAEPRWCFLVDWKPDAQDDFRGRLDATLVAHRDLIDGLVEELEVLVLDVPLDRHGGKRRGAIRHGEAHAVELSLEHFGGSSDYADIGLSSAGREEADARAIQDVLRGAGYRVNWYKHPESREDKRGLMAFMETLRNQPVLILLVSEDSLRPDGETNPYCWFELADAMIEVAAGRRSAQRTLVVFKTGTGFSFGDFDQRVSAGLRVLLNHFLEQRKNPDCSPYARDFCARFDKAVEQRVRERFLRECGSGGSAMGLEEARQDGWAKLLKRCQELLGPRRRGLETGPMTEPGV